MDNTVPTQNEVLALVVLIVLSLFISIGGVSLIASSIH
jgi:hypothetical protein